jgi:hypothetical protein
MLGVEAPVRHHQKHDGVLRRTGFGRARPERPIESTVCRLELWRLKAVERIARGIRPKGGCTRQQQRDQIRRALGQAIEPVIHFQGPPTGTARLATKSTVRQYQ